MIRLATVGTSSICDNFLKGVALTGRFSLEAVYSRNYDTGTDFAKRHNCQKVFADLEEMAKNEDIEAVYIASPNAFHYEQSRLFLENGKHVICEKPIVTNLSEYKELKALADSKGLIYMDAIIPIYNKDRNALISALKEIGNIRMVRIDFSQRSSRLDKFLNGEQVNIFDMSLKAGCFMDLGVYCVYGALDLLGEPLNLSAGSVFFENGADSSGYAIFDYGFFPAVISYSKTGQSVLGSEIIGDEGTIKIPSISQYTGITLIKNGTESKITRDFNKAELMSFEAEAFADYISDFAETKDDYNRVSVLTEKVIEYMDIIKNKAGIKYPEK